VSDELHQLAVAGRSGEVRDVLIDFCGALLGIAFFTLLTKVLKFKFIKKYT
jgi:VanZ family protein